MAAQAETRYETSEKRVAGDLLGSLGLGILANGDVGQNQGCHFRVGEFTHFRTNFSGDWDVHWGYNLGFDPWPCAPSNRL